MNPEQLYCPLRQTTCQTGLCAWWLHKYKLCAIVKLALPIEEEK